MTCDPISTLHLLPCWRRRGKVVQLDLGMVAQQTRFFPDACSLLLISTATAAVSTGMQLKLKPVSRGARAKGQLIAAVVKRFQGASTAWYVIDLLQVCVAPSHSPPKEKRYIYLSRSLSPNSHGKYVL